MGNCFSATSDFCLNKVFQWVEEKGGYNHNLEKNLVDLERAMEELKAKRDDLSRRLTIEEDRGLQRLSVFQVWLNRVETIEKNVNALLSDRDVELQRMYVCRFCYGYGENVFLTLKEVVVLKSDVFDVIADQAQTSEVQKRPIQRIIVGQETMLETAWTHLMEDGVGILGMHGMGGVGKTTLLKQIHNKFSDKRCGFNFVIWVVVSKELHVEKIQDEIAEKAGLGGEDWIQKDKFQKSVDLYNFLMRKRFVLFLDDIWEKVELDEIGIPFPTPENKCKVTFTTRSQGVCASMGAEELMEVQCLTEDDAFDLFQKKIGQTTLETDPGIPDLAKIVAKKCCGLPLALNVIGETMSCKRTVREWRHAINVLTTYVAKFSNMEDKILMILKYSYDSLSGEDVKQCLLYCALFPEDARIPKEGLIEYWISEGIIDGSEGIEAAEDMGYELIGRLVCASVLMEGVDQYDRGIVFMHDVVREMALWIASDLGKQKESFIVHAGVGLREIPHVRNWNVVRKISLMNNDIPHLTDNPMCPVLTTLLMQFTRLGSISSTFFKSMPKLAVLDLSGNYNLYELPEGISNLVSLQYLSLSRTGICHLPMDLTKLIHLDLEETSQLKSIVGISSLHNLKVLKLSGSHFPWDLDTVKELETLEHLEILTTTIVRPPGPEQFLSSHRLMSRTRFLNISNSNMQSSGISLPVTMDKLCDFSIRSCTLSKIKIGRKCSFLSLVKVQIKDCECMRELTFLMFTPNLKILFVRKADQLEDIISKVKACEGEESGIVPFQKLVHLRLAHLPKLKNIYWSPLPFPCLEQIDVDKCPKLKKLPVDSKSGKNELFIRPRPRNWIRGVKWEDQATETRFLASLNRYDYTHKV